MHPKLAATVFEWSAGLIIGLIPILCHLMLTLSGGGAEAPGAWTVDILFVAITTSGLSAVTLFTRLSRGTLQVHQLKPHSMILMAINMVTFLLAGVMFGEVSAGVARASGLLAPVAFLVVATAASLYFEILVALEVIGGD